MNKGEKEDWSTLLVAIAKKKYLAEITLNLTEVKVLEVDWKREENVDA